MNELKKDYGKDYHVEISDEKPPKITGKVIYVQLKGADGADYRLENTVVAHKLELKHLKYLGVTGRPL